MQEVYPKCDIARSSDFFFPLSGDDDGSGKLKLSHFLERTSIKILPPNMAAYASSKTFSVGVLHLQTLWLFMLKAGLAVNQNKRHTMHKPSSPSSTSGRDARSQAVVA